MKHTWPEQQTWQWTLWWEELVGAGSPALQSAWHAWKQRAPKMQSVLVGEGTMPWNSVATPDWAYRHPAAFVLRHGHSYRPQTLPEGFALLKARDCFRNAFQVAEKHGLTYAEGYASPWVGLGRPPLHAWCIDEQGGVVDVTWSCRGDAHREGYFGVPFPLEKVQQKHTSKNQCPSLIDDWSNGWPLLRWNRYADGDPYEGEATPASLETIEKVSFWWTGL